MPYRHTFVQVHDEDSGFSQDIPQSLLLFQSCLSNQVSENGGNEFRLPMLPTPLELSAAPDCMLLPVQSGVRSYLDWLLYFCMSNTHWHFSTFNCNHIPPRGDSLSSSDPQSVFELASLPLQFLRSANTLLHLAIASH